MELLIVTVIISVTAGFLLGLAIAAAVFLDKEAGDSWED
jgi:uncharacterized membrane protein SpoIIM required for sporulation